MGPVLQPVSETEIQKGRFFNEQSLCQPATLDPPRDGCGRMAVCAANGERCHSDDRLFPDPRSSPDTFADQIAGFHRGLKNIGFVDKVNVAIEYAWGEDQFERLPALAAELVRRPVAVIVASGGSNLAMVAKSATTASRSFSPSLFADQASRGFCL